MLTRKGKRMYYVASLVCMSIFTVFCSAMDPVKHQTRAAENRRKALFSSIVYYKYEETKHLISQDPSLVDTFGSYKYHNLSCENITPVHLAAWVGNSVALEQLFAVSKKSVDAVTEEGNSPLHLASNECIAELLLQNGAQRDKLNQSKYTPLHAALYGIAFYDHEPRFDVAYCLLKHGADINQRCRFGTTVLHKASTGNMSSEYAKFLLNHGADGDVKDNSGETSFDQVIEQAKQREVFQQSGYCYCWVQQQSNDPFELFKQDPELFFLEKNTIWNIMKDLYTTALKQEKGREPISNKSDAIVIKVSKNSKLYIFKRASFADLEMYFGKKSIDYLRNYFQELYVKDRNAIENGRKPMYKIHITDEDGDSLLHTAVKCKQSEIIKYLIDDEPINCIVPDNRDKLACDYLNNSACKAAFLNTLAQKFFAKELDQKVEEFFLSRLFSYDEISDQGRLYYFLMTLRHYPEKSSFFLQNRIDVNGKYKKKSPLVCAVEPWLKTAWRIIPAIHKYNIRALLQCGAKVNRNLIEASHGYMQKLLHQTYNAQK